MRALVLSGGGAKGAYQVGAIQHLLGERGFEYEVLAGTSVGALNSAFVAMYPVGQEPEAVEGLLDIWHSVRDEAIFRSWYLGLVGKLPVVLPRRLWGIPFLGKQSCYSTAPLRELVGARLNHQAVRDSGRKLRVGAVNLVTGESEYWHEDAGEALVDGVLASSSFPMFFEPVARGDALYTDDGIREITPIKQAIEAGADELHVVCASPERVVGAFDPQCNGLPLGQRILDAMSAEIDRWDLKAAELYNALVDAGAPGYEDRRRVTLTVLRPSGPVLDNALDFDPAKIRDNIERGRAEAAAVAWGA